MGLSFGDTTTLVCLGTSTTETMADGYGRINTNELTTLFSLQGSTTEALSNKPGTADKDLVKSLFTTAVTTTTTSIGPDVNVRLDATRDYVASMSAQEIDKMLIEIDEQEKQILTAVDYTSKVKTIGSKNKF